MFIKKQGFTLIELLIVISIIGIIAAVVYVALDPLTRFQDSRDSVRWQDASEIATAIKVNQVDNGGIYPTAISSLTPGEIYMISGDNTTSGCNAQNSNCDVAVTDSNNCIDLSGLVAKGYMGKIPVSPNGNGSWTKSITGFTLMASSTGAITIQACESEHSAEISITR